MITTLRVMQMSRIKTSIIGLLLAAAALLGGCSSVRLAYGNGAQLAWWWLDAYVDFSAEQAPQVKQGINALFDWHRSSQLPAYAALLGTAQQQVLEPTTPELACRWQTQVRELLEPTLQRALALAAEQSSGLGEAQFRHLEQRYAKGISEMREDFLQPDLAERQAKSVERAVERAERLYGGLAPAQMQVVREGVLASPFDPALWLQERQRRQREVLDTLRRLASDKADADLRLAAMRKLAAHTEVSPDAVYRAYQLKLTAYNCALAARIHNAAPPAQRQQARATLKGWEEDLRALLSPPG
jgi:Family of unknown function (DUF6279)